MPRAVQRGSTWLWNETRQRLIRHKVQPNVCESLSMSPQKSTLQIVLQPLLIALGAALLIRGTLLQTFTIPSSSMAPTLQRGDHILAIPYGSPLFGREPARGDVIVFRRGDAGEFFIKRVVAGPGDEIGILANGFEVNASVSLQPPLSPASYDLHAGKVMSEDEFFVMGDDRDNSIDSRVFGPIERRQIVARASLVFWSSASSEWDINANASPVSDERLARSGVRWDRIMRPIH